MNNDKQFNQYQMCVLDGCSKKCETKTKLIVFFQYLLILLKFVGHKNFIADPYTQSHEI